jgi:tRNA (cmo5U34)-methyltransferase
MKFDSGIAAEYDRGVRRTLPSYDSMLRLTHTFLRANLPEKAALLIVGGGGGNEIKTFGTGNQSWAFTAIDPSEAMLKAGKNKAQQLGIDDRVDWIKGTVTNIPEESVFDGATCLLVLHFVADVNDKLAMLQKVRAHLKEGAPFVLVSKVGDPDTEEFKEQVGLWKNYWLDNTGLPEAKVNELMKGTLTESSISEERLRQLLAEAGFHRIARFFQTNHFGGWICRAK